MAHGQIAVAIGEELGEPSVTGRRTDLSAGNAEIGPLFTPSLPYTTGIKTDHGSSEIEAPAQVAVLTADLKREAYAAGERLYDRWIGTDAFCDFWGERRELMVEDFAEEATELYCRLHAGNLTDEDGAAFVRLVIDHVTEGFTDSRSCQGEPFTTPAMQWAVG